MESRFNKYENNNQTVANHIANVNVFINQLYEQGLDLIEREINDLQSRIEQGNAPTIFSNKKDKLIKLGKCIESLYETYHFNKAA